MPPVRRTPGRSSAASMRAPMASRRGKSGAVVPIELAQEARDCRAGDTLLIRGWLIARPEALQEVVLALERLEAGVRELLGDEVGRP